jgi:catechol 2,3-dioxygenase-like lactoylglutathione lyase family enzyme
MAVIRFGHLGICVSSLAVSVPFYRDLLGFRTLTQVEVKGADADKLLGLSGVDQTTVFVERDGVRLALFEFRSPKLSPERMRELGEARTTGRMSDVRQMNVPGMAAIMLRVDDIEATLTRIRAASVQVFDETRTDYPEYGSRLVFLADPDGTLIELVEIPGDPYAPFGKPYTGA